MKTNGDDLKRFEYEFEYWTQTIGFEPTALIASVDNAGAWETSALHVFKLKRGYAIVHESGCSCYTSADASIDILPSIAKVKESLKNIAKEEYSEGELARDLLKIMTGINKKDE